MAMFWSTSAFWFVIVVALLVLGLTIAQSVKDGDSAARSTSIAVLSVFLIVSFIFNFGKLRNDKSWKAEAISDITGGEYVEERLYYDVEFMGGKASVFNYSDARWYADMGNGSMISYNRIRNERLCRMCDQFKEGSVRDSIYVYRVQKDEPRWWNSGPVLFFSKHPDIFLQGSQRMEL